MSQADPIVIVPGFMGSRLVEAASGSVVWVDLAWVPFRIDALVRDLNLSAVPPVALSAGGILEDVPLGDLVHFGVYRPMREWACARGYGLGLAPEDVHEFGYDWRQSVVPAAAALDRFLDGLRDTGRGVTLVAHSQGGLVAAELFRKAGPGSRRVTKLVAIGCPFAGLLKTIDMIEKGSGVLTALFPSDPLREVLRGFPATYELMPSGTAPALFRDASGVPATPFETPDSLPSTRYDPGLLARAGAVVTALSPRFPVPAVLVEGYGVDTAVSASAAGGAVRVDHGPEGDGTCPSASLLAASGVGPGGNPARRVLSVPFGEHVGLVKHPDVLRYLASDLTNGRGRRFPSQVTAAVRRRAAIPGVSNLLVVETRDGSGDPLGSGPPEAWLESGGPVPLAACPVAGPARWVGAFPHPAAPTRLVTRVPGIAPSQQPAPILLGP